MRLPTVVSCAGWKCVYEDRADAPQQQLHRLAHEHKIGVVRDEGAGRAKMNERTGGRRLIAEVVDMRHHIVTQPSLVFRGLLEVGIVEMGPQLRQRGVRNREAQLFFPLHQREPQPAPQADTAALAPERLHRGRGVARRERRNPAQTAAFARATSLLQSARN